MAPLLMVACDRADDRARQMERTFRRLCGARNEDIALLFPSEGCPCRYAPLLDALRSAGAGEPPPLVLALAAPASAHPEETSDVPHLWNEDVRRLRDGYCLGKDAGPFLVLVRAGPIPEVLLAARVPEVPVRQKELARVVLALAGEREAKP